MSAIETDIVVAAAFILGGLVVKLTPTKVDDAWWRKLKGLVGR